MIWPQQGIFRSEVWHNKTVGQGQIAWLRANKLKITKTANLSRFGALLFTLADVDGFDFGLEPSSIIGSDSDSDSGSGCDTGANPPSEMKDKKD